MAQNLHKTSSPRHDGPSNTVFVKLQRWYTRMILFSCWYCALPYIPEPIWWQVCSRSWIQSISVHMVVPHLWWAMVWYGIATLLMRLSGSLSQFFWMRMRYVSDNCYLWEFSEANGEIDIPYHEDPTFQSTVKRVEDALAWRVMGMLTNVSMLVTNAIGALDDRDTSEARLVGSLGCPRTNYYRLLYQYAFWLWHLGNLDV